LAGTSHLLPASVLKVKRTLTGKIFVQTNKFTSARMDALCLKSFSPLQIEADYMFRFQQEMV
jgi:hypothetical protein